MGDEAPNGEKYAPEQIAAVSQALLLLQQHLFGSAPASLQVADLLDWHLKLTTPLGIRAGQWRTGEITFGSYYGFAPGDIDAAMAATYARANQHLEYLSYLEGLQQLEELIRVSAYVHARLIKIHPFEDGNGRVSRLVLQAMFLGAGFDPPDLSSLERTYYLLALNQYNLHGTDDLYCRHLEPLKKLILELL